MRSYFGVVFNSAVNIEHLIFQNVQKKLSLVAAIVVDVIRPIMSKFRKKEYSAPVTGSSSIIMSIEQALLYLWYYEVRSASGTNLI